MIINLLRLIFFLQYVYVYPYNIRMQQSQDKYQCHICMQTAQKPIVTPCGHLFCWQCIYHWLRSNQQYLTCPLCKSGLELSSVRPILLKDQPPQKQQGGIPPRPRPGKQIKKHQNNGDIPKTLLAMGMNVQRGVMLAGYGIFPSTYQSMFHHFKKPEIGEERVCQNMLEVKIYGGCKIVTWIVAVVALVVMILC